MQKRDGSGEIVSLSEKELEHLKDLARIRLDRDLREKFRFQLDAVIGFVAELKKVDISKHKDTAEMQRGSSRLRADEPEDSLSRKTVLEEAPGNNGRFFSVPPVIDNENE
ncbi:MAG: Asp-tRNA(Asn)/Glu-tRNA(Gln) amidotransferase subunit GatC [Candidatus Krumholzibacteriota bacterium]|nr:Asp-tRNA(Asn)/Glu-tRNA(Gln) amidotransferase subunit GatC [Candidatus Krumholzibacteriota bacterium]